VLDSLTTPAALAGLVAPAIAFHLYRRLQEKAGEEPDPGRRASRFVTATVLSLAVTEAAAIFGTVAFLLSSRSIALIGVVLHVLLCGAIWPSRDRMDSFVAGAGGRG
jgi:hypothetical protein